MKENKPNQKTISIHKDNTTSTEAVTPFLFQHQINAIYSGKGAALSVTSLDQCPGKVTPEDLIYHSSCQRQLQCPFMQALEGGPHLGCWFRTQRRSRRYQSPRCPGEPPPLFGIQRYSPKSGMKEYPDHTAPLSMEAVQMLVWSSLFSQNLSVLSSVTLCQHSYRNP